MPFCDAAQALNDPGNVSLRPQLRDLGRARRGTRENSNQEIQMLSNVARWGHNVLLAGTGLLTVIVFYYLVK
jgi:hypothetical protein